MPSTQDIINDPDFNGLPAIEKKKVLQQADQDFSGLPDEEQNKVIESFSSNSNPDLSKMGRTKGSFLKDVRENTLESLPLYGSPSAAKEGFARGEQLFSPAVLGADVPGHEIAGKIAGSVLGAGSAFNTLFNPVGKALGFYPKLSQAVGSTLGGDTQDAERDLTGARPLIAGSKAHAYDTGIPGVDTALNLSDELGRVVQQQPFTLGALAGSEATPNLNAAMAEATGKAISPITNLAQGIKNSLTPSLEKIGDQYRQVLAPGKNEIKNIEVKGGKDLNDYYKLAAEEGLVIQKAPDGKLDTKNAINQLQEKIDPLHEELQAAIESSPEQQFDIFKLAEKTKPELRKAFKNDANYEEALASIKNEVDAILRNRGGGGLLGNEVDGATLNEIKQGMWSKSYNAMAPNSNRVARIFGRVLKTAIEDAYPQENIKGLNKQLGDYYTLQSLLENANGRVVAKGKLGKYVAQGTGALIGHSIGLPVVGEIAGAKAGGMINDFLTDPERITSGLAKKAKNLKESEAP
jgi:hypothetical protein